MKAPAFVLACLLATSATAQIGVKFDNSAATATYIEVPWDPTLAPLTGLTIEAWITYDDSTIGTGWRWPTIARQNPQAGQESFWFRVQAGNSQGRTLALGTTTSSGLTTVNYPFQAGEFSQWTHVAATYDGQVSRIYINGVLRATGSQIGPNLINNGGVLRIGNGDGNPIETWNGEIDEVRLWPYARTADEIQSTMNYALTSIPGEVSSWNLDFNPKDSSGKNDGNDVNNPNYQLNSLRLNAGKIGATAFGASTPSCAGMLAAGVTGRCAAGNNGFGLTCLRAAKANASGVLGFVWVGTGRLNSPVLVNNANVWVDPSQPGLLVPVAGDRNGLTNVSAPVPANTPMGTKVYLQFFYHHPGCKTVPMFASDALELEVQ